jgi:hypothetical protein
MLGLATLMVECPHWLRWCQGIATITTIGPSGANG